MKIGFIGLGNMGSAIAANLLKTGHELTVWNRSPGAAEALAAKGAHAAKTPQDALQGDILFSMLASDDAIRAVGLDGALLAQAKAGLVHVNLATSPLPLHGTLRRHMRRKGWITSRRRCSGGRTLLPPAS
jgi:3-hydroxyisobutyrate dehydrogenase-like beta-hydroxyacid dehydrogenase